MIRPYGTNETEGQAARGMAHGAYRPHGSDVAIMPISEGEGGGGEGESHSANTDSLSAMPNPRATQRYTGSRRPWNPPSQIRRRGDLTARERGADARARARARESVTRSLPGVGGDTNTGQTLHWHGVSVSCRRLRKMDGRGRWRPHERTFNPNYRF
jgi:hypothetical protein